MVHLAGGRFYRSDLLGEPWPTPAKLAHRLRVRSAGKGKSASDFERFHRHLAIAP
jgi:hypothetical protein